MRFDFLGFKFGGEGDVVYFDYEQPMHLHHYRLKQMCYSLNLKKTPKNMFVYHKRHSKQEERLETLKSILERINPKILFLDGIADLVISVNDEVGCTNLIEGLMEITDKHNCCIVLILHENSMNAKIRGHLGSIIERKCDVIINISEDKKGNIFKVEQTLTRYSYPDVLAYFKYNPESKLIESVNASEVKKDHVVENSIKVAKIFSRKKFLTHKELCEAIQAEYNIKFDSAKKKVKSLVNMALLKRLDDGQYIKMTDTCTTK